MLGTILSRLQERVFDVDREFVCVGTLTSRRSSKRGCGIFRFVVTIQGIRTSKLSSLVDKIRLTRDFRRKLNLRAG
jgi:hypothetical protein